MAKVYVGTYKKYNNGNLMGAWLDLADYDSYEEFVKACRKLHKDERDPEFMIQDSEDFPDGLDCGEWMRKDDFDAVKLAMKEELQEADGKPSINIIDYSEKSFAVVGETYPVKDSLKKLGGRFNGKLSCGAGWIFSNTKREEVEKFINSGIVAEAVRKERGEEKRKDNRFIEWLNEYKANGGNEYDVKHSIGAVKIHDHFYMIPKPGIENRFCFRDEGEEYEFYKSLLRDDKKMAEYFKQENLSDFDRKIGRIEKGDYCGDTRIFWKNGNGSTLYISFDSWQTDGYTPCTEEEKKLILMGLKFGREMFEKKLDTYLKRYGVSKLHTWSYWADA